MRFSGAVMIGAGLVGVDDVAVGSDGVYVAWSGGKGSDGAQAMAASVNRTQNKVLSIRQIQVILSSPSPGDIMLLSEAYAASELSTSLGGGVFPMSTTKLRSLAVGCARLNLGHLSYAPPSGLNLTCD